MTEQQSTTFS